MGYRQRTTIRLLGERPKSAYAIIPKDLLADGELTPDARLVGIYLLSLTDGWQINQAQIAEALSMGANKRRVGNAIQNLVKRGWLRHNEHKSGNRVFKHEYVMNRSRRFSDDPYGTKSVPLYGTTVVLSPKYQRNHADDTSESSGTGVPAAPIGWGESPSCIDCYALPEEPRIEGCPNDRRPPP